MSGTSVGLFFLFADLSSILAFAFFPRMSDDKAVSILFRHSAAWSCTCGPHKIAEHAGHIGATHVCRNPPSEGAPASPPRSTGGLEDFFISNSGKSPSASLSPPPLFHGTAGRGGEGMVVVGRVGRRGGGGGEEEGRLGASGALGVGAQIKDTFVESWGRTRPHLRRLGAFFVLHNNHRRPQLAIAKNMLRTTDGHVIRGLMQSPFP